MKPRVKPKQILLSQRANVFYLEHVRVHCFGERLVYAQEDGEFDKIFNIPEKNTAFILLGKGSSITDSAIRKLAESNVIVGFTGSGGSPLFAVGDITFLEPQSDYRPTEYMQAWVIKWLDESIRLSMAKKLFINRMNWAMELWGRLKKTGYLENFNLPIDRITYTSSKINAVSTTQQLLGVEAEWAKGTYRDFAKSYEILSFKRNNDEAQQTEKDAVNRFLDHGNYIAYGYAAAALNVLGISFAFPVMHGKTRRGALVFDIADLFKDAFVVPLAFHYGSINSTQKEFRSALIDLAHKEQLLDRLLDTIIAMCNETYI